MAQDSLGDPYTSNGVTILSKTAKTGQLGRFFLYISVNKKELHFYMKPSNNTLFAYSGLILMTIIVGLSFIFVKIGLQHADSYEFLAHRFTIAFVVIFLMRITGLVKHEKKSKKEWIEIVIVSMLYPLAFFLFQTIGMQYSTVSHAGIIMAILPVATVIAAAIFLKERTSTIQKIGILLSASALVFIFLMNSNTDSGFNVRGSIFLILSVLVMVGYYMKGKVLMQKHNSMDLTSVMITIGFIVFNSINIIRQLNSGTISEYFTAFTNMSFLISIVYLGVLSSVLTSFLSNYALSHVNTYQVSIFNNLSPLITIFAGVLFMHDTLSAVQITGATIVIVGVVMVLVSKSR